MDGLRVSEDGWRCAASVERETRDGDATAQRREGGRVRREVREQRRQRRSDCIGAAREQSALGAGVAGRSLERGMLEALKLCAGVVERVPQRFVLHQQQEHR